MDDHHKNLRRGFNWLGSATIIAKLIDFGTTLAVLWFLTKDQVGIGSLVWSIAFVVEATEGLGTGAAILQAKSISRLQLDSVFWFSIGVAVIAGALVWLAAPLIQDLYHIPGLANYFVAVIAKLLFVGAALVPLQMLNRELKYERIAVVNVSATLGAALTRLTVAAMGGGAWAIVIGYAAHGLYVLIGVQIANPFVPRLRFRLSAITGLIHFGFRAAAAETMQQLFRNVDYLLVGWFYGPGPLAIYRVAFDITMEPAAAIGDLVNRTALPVFSRFSVAKEQVAQSFTWAIGRIVTLIGPFMAALILSADQLTALIHDANGASYSAAALPLKILAGAAVLRALYQLLYPLVLGTGRPGMAVRMSASTLLMLTVGLLGAGMIFQAQHGIVAMSLVWLAIYPLLLVWGARFAVHTYALNMRELASSMAIPVTATAAMIAAIEMIRLLANWPNPYLQITVTLTALALTYAGMFFYTRRRIAKLTAGTG
ncbi:MAG: hypothetical protein B7Z66_10930 [Chromatiales bacterium 21-64-14]|nr:MAG: hypothetical protein B7Z66_10930 [Chromatiales bacterium 21-64-14]HQU15602.1 oligosaccharide flippase family protein [Gammaproteobacteria bacterium]